MFIIESFNRAWERERQQVAARLSGVLDNEIKSIRFAIKVEENGELRSELNRMLPQLVSRKSLVDYESEEIVKRRMDIRASYLAIVVSGAAFMLSVLTATKVVFK